MARLAFTVPLAVVVFDREREDAETLAACLRTIQPSVRMEVTPVWHVTELGPVLSSGVDLLFMSIGNTGQRHDGVDLVLKLVPRDSRTRVIFVGGDIEDRRRVYLADHLWHLLRPVSHIELAEAMERATEVIDRDRERAIVLRAGRADTVVSPHDITYIESDLRMLCVHERGRVIETYGKLADMASLLPSHFVRCHKSYLVNLEHVIGMDERTLRLDSGEEIPVSQRRYTVTRKALHAHFRSLRSYREIPRAVNSLTEEEV